MQIETYPRVIILFIRLCIESYLTKDLGHKSIVYIYFYFANFNENNFYLLQFL